MPGLAAGQVRFRIERFAVTANTVTYATTGDILGYWDFFPTGEPDWGCVPAMGWAEIVESQHPDVAHRRALLRLVPDGAVRRHDGDAGRRWRARRRPAPRGTCARVPLVRGHGSRRLLPGGCGRRGSARVAAWTVHHGLAGGGLSSPTTTGSVRGESWSCRPRARRPSALRIAPTLVRGSKSSASRRRATTRSRMASAVTTRSSPTTKSPRPRRNADRVDRHGRQRSRSSRPCTPTSATS